MGGNGVSGDYYFDRSYGDNELYRSLTGFFTRSLNYAPGNIWNARMANQMWNGTTHNLSFPYGQYFNFTGRPRYVVASNYEMPYSVAMGLHGYSSRSTYADLIAARDSVTMQHQLSSRPSRVMSQIESVKTIGEWKDNEALADQPELQKQAKELEEEAVKLAKRLDLLMKNEAGLDPSSVLEGVAEIEKEASALGTRAKELFEKIQEAKTEYDKKKADEAKKAAKDKAEEGDDPSVENPDDAVDDSDAPAEDERPDYVPPENKTSPEKDKVTKEGTRVKVKAKGGTEELAGKYYEYDGKIYKVTNGEAKPVDVTDKVEKIPAAS